MFGPHRAHAKHRDPPAWIKLLRRAHFSASAMRFSRISSCTGCLIPAHISMIHQAGVPDFHGECNRLHCCDRTHERNMPPLVRKSLSQQSSIGGSNQHAMIACPQLKLNCVLMHCKCNAARNDLLFLLAVKAAHVLLFRSRKQNKNRKTVNRRKASCSLSNEAID